MKQIFLALNLIFSAMTAEAATSMLCQKDNGKIIFNAVFADAEIEAGSYTALAIMKNSNFGSLDVKGQASLAYTKREAAGGGLYISEFIVKDTAGEDVILTAIHDDNSAEFLDAKNGKKFSGYCLARRVRPAISGSN